MATTKEKVEAKNAVEAVKEADAKVEKIKADKAAASAAKDAEILAKHPKIGSKINWVRHNKWKIAGAAATGGVSFAAGWFGHKFFGKKAEGTDTVIDISTEEAQDVPFDTEA